MPPDLNEVRKSDLIPPAADVEVSRMSFTESDATALFNQLLDVEPLQGEGDLGSFGGCLLLVISGQKRLCC